MRLSLLTRTLVLVAVAARLPDAGAERPLPEPIPTRQTMFSIPFRVEQGYPAATQPVGVQLQVSTDHGATWRAYSKVEPSLGRFLFRAGGDGEYWFVVQTVDHQGLLRPSEPTEPGLCVLVDTTPPQVEMATSCGEAGEITARWRITEIHPKLDTLRILYRTDPSQTWQSVAVDRSRMATEGQVCAGEVTWWPQVGGSRVEIRAEVSDLAGNSNVSHAHVELKAAPQASPNLTAMVPAQPPAAANVPPSSEWRSAAVRPAPTTPAAPQPAAPPPQALVARPPVAAAPVASAPGNPYRPDSAAPQTSGKESGLAGGSGSPSKSLPAQPASVAIQINPAIGSQYHPPADTHQAEQLALGDGQRPRMVNTTMFELEYAVESVGPSGIARVELWGTPDGGQSWSSFGTDDDKQSPMIVHVPGEGVFGFRVAVQSGVGLGGEPPQSGTTPDVWIGVDMTKPDVRLLNAEQSTGQDAGKLVITWEARDLAPARYPVSLLYSDTRGGPWTSIAADLENTGQHAWAVPNEVPEQLYLRIEFRDEAGNLGVYELPEPVHLDRHRPNVRIQEIRPVGPTARTAPRRYLFR